MRHCADNGWISLMGHPSYPCGGHGGAAFRAAWNPSAYYLYFLGAL